MRKTKRRQALEAKVEALTNIRGVTHAWVEYSPDAPEIRGQPWNLVANTRTGSKEILCSNLDECEEAFESLRQICENEARLSDAECDAIVERHLNAMTRRIS